MSDPKWVQMPPVQNRERATILISKGWISEGKGRWHHPDFEGGLIVLFHRAWENQDLGQHGCQMPSTDKCPFCGGMVHNYVCMPQHQCAAENPGTSMLESDLEKHCPEKHDSEDNGCLQCLIDLLREDLEALRDKIKCVQSERDRLRDGGDKPNLTTAIECIRDLIALAMQSFSPNDEYVLGLKDAIDRVDCIRWGLPWPQTIVRSTTAPERPLVSDRDVQCENCPKVDRRPFMRPCPRDWFYIESNIDGQAYLTWACSEECAEKLWRPGPGPNMAKDPPPINWKAQYHTALQRITELEKQLSEKTEK